MNESFEVVVAGGGLAGLTAALTAALGGASTLLVDPHPVGGRARSQVRDGFILNNGPHALYRGGETIRTLGDFGIELSSGSPMYDGAGALCGGKVLPLPLSAGALLRTKMLSPISRLKAAKVLGGLTRLDASAWVGRSVEQWLATMPVDVAGLIDTLVRASTYVDDAQSFDAGAAIQQLQAANRGVLYLDGGWQRMVDALLGVVLAAGVEVRSGVGIDCVELTENGLLVQAGGSSIDVGAAVIAVGGPAETARVIGHPITGVGRLSAAVEASVLDLGVRKVPPVPLLFGNGVPLYLSTHSSAAELSPDGLGLVTVMRYLRPGTPPAEPGEARAELRRFAALAGIVDDDIVLDRYLHRVTVAHGYPLATAGGLNGRPTIDAAGIDGVYLAGDWVGDRGLLADASTASAVAAAQAALRSIKAPA